MAARSTFDPIASAPRSRAALWIGWAVLAAIVLPAAAWWGHQSAASIGVRGAGVQATDRAASAALSAASPATAAAAATTTAAANTHSAQAVQPPWPLWEFRLRQPIPPREPSLTPPGWRLVGAVQTGGQWRLVIQTQGKPEPQFLKVGDALPGGARIVAISEEDVTLQRGARQLVLSYIGY